MRSAATIALGLLVLVANAQRTDGPAQAHARIDSLYKAGRHAEVVAEVEAQLQRVAGTTWQDSIAGYIHRYGRSMWRSVHADAGVAAAERLHAQVLAAKGDPVQQLNAYEGLSLLYYDVGRIKECLRVDSIALAFALRQGDRIPAARLGKAYHYLAFDHAVVGDHVKAVQLELAAVAAYERAEPVPSLLIAESYMGVGTAYWHAGRIQDADKAYARTLDHIGDRQDLSSLLLKASALGNRGILWQAAGDVARSKEYYLRSIAIQDEVVRSATDPVKRETAIFNRSKGYVNLATVYFGVGDLARVNDLLQRAWNDRSAILEPDDPQLVRLHERFADMEQARGDHAKAADHLRTYLGAMGRSHGRRSIYYVDACWRLAVEESYLGHPARTDSLFEVALALCREIGVDHTGREQEMVFRERAQVRTREGRTADALADLRKALAWAVRIYGNENAGALRTRLEMAGLQLRTGEHGAALAQCDTVLQVLREQVEAVRADGPPRPSMAPHLLADALHMRVSAQRQADMVEQAGQWSSDLDLAITSLRRNKALLSDADSRLRLVGSQERLFDLALDIASEQYLAGPGDATAQRFLDLSETDRSTLLKARLDQFSGMRFAGVPDAVVAREGQLIANLEEVGDAPDLAHVLDRVERDYAAFLDSLRRSHPRYYDLRYGERTVPLQEVRNRLLTKHRTLLVYAITDEHLHCLVVRPDTTVLVSGDVQGLQEEAEALGRAVRDRDADAYLKLGHSLYRRVIAPVAGLLKGDELLVVPDGVLHTINFECLLDAPSTRQDLAQHVLLRKYAIAQLLSVTTAVQFARIDTERARGVLAIAPGFSDDMKQAYVAQLRDSTLLDRSYLQYVRQPFAVKAVTELEDRFSAHAMVGAAANEHDLRKEVGTYGILHLGTHAELNTMAPMYSRLVLGKATEAGDDDGYLHAYEIYELDLRAQLAVLTACETGIGRTDNGEGVRSLGYGFAYAGCPSLVMSLWQIDEKVSAEIITSFYGNLAKGMPKHKALQQAKLKHLDTARDELQLPYYWAGMVLVGDVSPVELPFWPRYRWWIGGGSVLLLAAVVWIVRRRRAR